MEWQYINCESGLNVLIYPYDTMSGTKRREETNKSVLVWTSLSYCVIVFTVCHQKTKLNYLYSKHVVASKSIWTEGTVQDSSG